ncbi:hypothetical protein FRB93_008089 [Tulasnella sp. JGI-2019a]|nr:hypothetical protein FRB93_008089 [Tulasnella sp. JGI-2019a]
MINKHFIFSTCPAFGHIRPQIGVVCKLVAADPHLLFTIFSANFFVPVILQEITRSSGSVTESLTRIRVIGVGRREPPPPGMPLGDIGDMFMQIGREQGEAYRELVKENSMTCTTTDKAFDYHDIPKPSLAMVDVFVGEFAPAVKELTPQIIIVTAWPSGTCSFLSHFGPEEYGGLENLDARTKAVLQKDATATFDEVAVSLFNTSGGALYPNGEGVKLFEYENIPQAAFPVRIPLPAPIIMSALHLVRQYSDAAWINAPGRYQPKNSQIMENWYEKKLGKKVFFVGPQGSPTKLAPAVPSDAPNPFANVFAFLDKHPPKSVIYISFGTVFYPITDLWRIETVIKILLESRTPFIFSRAAMMFTPFSPELEKTLAENEGVGLVVDFVPQSEALAHPSMGAFLTHGGTNSLYESIQAGVLNIFWPQTADQPLHAAYMTENLDCAFELIQVRTGVGAGPPARGGKVEGTPEAVAAEFKQVLAEINGPVGERKQKNLNIIRQQFLDASKQGGEAEIALKGLADLGAPH